ncbi:MAG TPA: hypothetical protein VFV97_01995 [Rhodanobacteraceae bacterium]|nr:hypothetical protein [Rhodanobacteraceae bacterium]
MNDTARAPFAFALSVVSGIAMADGPAAQTCANPGYAVVNQTVVGNTCGANLMPTQNHGTILTSGGDTVLFVGGGPYGVSDLRLDAPAHEVFVFICSGCGPSEECVATGESGVNNGYVHYPFRPDGGHYYVIVDSPGYCADFQLTVLGPLKQDP